MAISWSKFHQTITKWIFLKSTRKGLLKKSKTEFLDILEAAKFKKQKCVQFCGMPCICILWKLYHAILNKLCNDTISPELHDITHEKYPCVCVDMLILPPLQLVKNSPPVSFLGSVSSILYLWWHYRVYLVSCISQSLSSATNWLERQSIKTLIRPTSKKHKTSHTPDTSPTTQSNTGFRKLVNLLINN